MWHFYESTSRRELHVPFHVTLLVYVSGKETLCIKAALEAPGESI